MSTIIFSQPVKNNVADKCNMEKLFNGEVDLVGLFKEMFIDYLNIMLWIKSNPAVAFSPIEWC